MKIFNRYFSFLVLTLMVGFVLPATANTSNPVDLIIDGGYTANFDVSETTQLFLDRENGKAVNFWVRVVDDPGTPQVFGISITPGGEEIPPASLPKSVYIKYFPVSRYVEVRKALKKIQNFGVVNPYVNGYVICDAPNSTIRFRRNSVFMAYNCGAAAPAADNATFEAEALLKTFRSETKAHPDLQGTIP